MSKNKGKRVVSEQFLITLSCIIIMLIVGMLGFTIQGDIQNKDNNSIISNTINISGNNIVRNDMEVTSRGGTISREKIEEKVEYKLYEFTINGNIVLYFDSLEIANSKQEYLLNNTNGLTITINEITKDNKDDLSNEETINSVITDYYNKYKKPTTYFPTVSHSISSYYGYRKSRGDFHSGIDLQGHYGDNIYAYKSGVVSKVQYSNRSYGNMVLITHSDGTQTRYAHMSSISVSNGQSVSGGQIIGHVGSTGNSTGNHLHFEVIINGKTVNPYNYIF